MEYLEEKNNIRSKPSSEWRTGYSKSTSKEKEDPIINNSNENPFNNNYNYINNPLQHNEDFNLYCDSNYPDYE